MLTVSIQLVDYNRSPSVMWLRLSRYTHALPRKGERIEAMPAFAQQQGAPSLSSHMLAEDSARSPLREGEKVTCSGTVNQLTWRGESEVIIEVFGTCTREGAHGPVST